MIKRIANYRKGLGLSAALVMTALFSTTVLATGSPLQKTASVQAIKGKPVSALDYAFNENQTVSVNLSFTNINRLFIKGDKITGIHAPMGALSARNDPTGSAYLTVLTSRPFTVFITTALGHHFSLLVIPHAEPGQTLAFHALQASPRVKAWEKNSTYQALLIKLFKAVLVGKVPPGYGYHKIAWQHYFAPNLAYTVNGLVIHPVGVYEGAALSVLVYALQNTTANTKVLLPNEFYKAGVRALALTRATLKPQEHGFVYAIVGGTNEGGV